MPVRPVSALSIAPLTVVALAAAGCASAHSPSASRQGSTAPAASSGAAATAAQFTELASTFSAQLGVYALDTGTKKQVSFDADERFAYASTYKALAAAALLAVDTDAQLAAIVPYSTADLVAYSPVTEKHVGTGMSVRDLCAAAIGYSDNTAGNLLFRELGGPAGLGAALGRLGDRTTHVDRIEPDLNEAVPNDIRDTSTARALAADLDSDAVGTVLSAAHKSLLTGWLKSNTTGAALIRAGVPTTWKAGWTVGDKSGAGSYGTRNDIAVVWPAGRAPIVLVVLSNRAASDASYDNRLISRAAGIALTALG